jgi:hypothetical protein
MTDVASPVTPPPVVERDGWPTWLRRVFIVLLLIAAAWFFVIATKHGQHGNADVPGAPPGLIQVPVPGARVLRQSEVGAQLEPGFDGRLVINGTRIPEDQMVGALDPGSSTAKRYGIRPNNKEQVLFLPGPHKVLTEFPPGPVTIQLTFWKIEQGQKDSQTISWQINVS